MCLHQILGAFSRKGDKRNSGENTLGSHVDAPAMIARTSTENNESSSTARAPGGDLNGSNINSNGSSNMGGGSSSGKSKEVIEEEGMDEIRRRAKRIEEENIKRHAALKAKGQEYQGYYSNDLYEY